MKLLIINGIPGNTKYADVEAAVRKEILTDSNHQIDYFVLRDMNIHYCTGCWDCWLKTPGKCAIRDDQEQIVSRFPHADMVLFITPVIAGYESALLKKLKDRMIIMALPYIRIYKGEQHHYPRYSKSPDLSVMLIKEEDTTTEDIELIQHTYERIALNFSSNFSGIYAVDNPGGVENVFHHL